LKCIKPIDKSFKKAGQIFSTNMLWLSLQKKSKEEEKKLMDEFKAEFIKGIKH